MRHLPVNQLLVTTLTLFSALGLTGCDNDDESITVPEPQVSVVSFAEENDQLSTLMEALDQADLIDVLSDENAEFTIFAPTNSAFADYLQDNANARTNQLTNISADVLRYHVVPGTTLLTELENSSLTTLLDGQTIEVSTSNGVVLNDSVRIISADNVVCNGVVHIVDAVLRTASADTIPEDSAVTTIATVITGTDTLSALAAALQRTPDLLETASDSSANLTVFAPTNEAFANLPVALEMENSDTLPDYVLRRVLEYHILEIGKLADQLGATEETREGAELSIDQTDGMVINGSANAVPELANIKTANGVVHVVDEVLIPPFIKQIVGTTLQPLVFDAEGQFTILVDALETQPDLLEFLLDADNKGTLFAPTDTAFEAFIDSTRYLGDVADLLALSDLGDILLYHVAADRKTSSDLITTLSAIQSRLPRLHTDIPLEIYYSKEEYNSLVLLGYSKVVRADIATPNEKFIIHAVDAVLRPPRSTVMEELANDRRFGEFIDAMVRAREASDESNEFALTWILNSEQTGEGRAPFTVFAPTDEAFDTLYTTLGVEGVDDIPAETWQAILRYHIVSGERVFSTGFDQLEGSKIETLGGTFTIDLDSLTIADDNETSEDATFVNKNVSATNGIIHVIDQVLLPELE